LNSPTFEFPKDGYDNKQDDGMDYLNETGTFINLLDSDKLK